MAKPKLPPRQHTRTLGQGLVEFALILPILLFLIFGIIDFARIFAAWLAVQNGARFGVRYAITGEYTPGYCANAMAFYRTHDIDGRPAGGSITPMLVSDAQDTYDNPNDGDPADAANDCNIPRQPARTVGGVPLEEIDATKANLYSSALQDFARLLSIRDAAQEGSVAIALNPGISGNYLNYLQNQPTYPSYSQTDRGQPYEAGYFQITVCANNMDVDGTYVYSPLPTGVTADQGRFPTPCLVPNRYNPATFRYTDSPGQPGERVRVVVTFRHPLITPLISSLWPTVRLEAFREGIVESFRKPRDVVLPQGVEGLPTYTPTPTRTNTPTITPTPTQTFTRTPTATRTNTPTRTNTSTPSNTPTPTSTACYSGGTGLRGEYYLYSGNAPTSVTDLNTVLPGYSLVRVANENINYSSSGAAWPSGIGSSTRYVVRWTGQVMAGYSQNYTFYFRSDDGIRLWINNQLLVDQWRTQGATEYETVAVAMTACQRYDIRVEYFQHTGGSAAELRWSSTNTPKQIVPLTALFPPNTAAPPTSTATNTRTATATPTRTTTPTITWTPNCNLSGAITTTDQQGLAQNIQQYDCPYGCLMSPYLKGAQDAQNQQLPPGTYFWRVETVGNPVQIVNQGSFFLAPGQFLGPPNGMIVPLGLFTNPPPANYYPGVFKVTLWQNAANNCGQKTDTFKIGAPAPSATPTSTASRTPTASNTPTRTNTPTATNTSQFTATWTPTATRTPTRTLPPQPTMTNCPAFEIDPVASGNCQATRAAMPPP